MSKCQRIAILSILFALTVIRSGIAAETLDQLIAGAKKEPELTFIAGAQTFGGPKTLAALEAAFNKRFGLNMKIRFAAGPEMNAMAARVITEQKSGAKTSTVYITARNRTSLCCIKKRRWSKSIGRAFFRGSPSPWRFFLKKECWSSHHYAVSSITPS